MNLFKTRFAVLFSLGLIFFVATTTAEQDQACSSARLQAVSNGAASFCVFSGHTDTVTSIASDSQRNLLVTGSDDGSIRFWSLETGGLLRTLDGKAGPVWSVYLQPGGDLFVSAHDDGSIKLWNLDTGALMGGWQAHDEAVYYAFFANDSVIVSGSCSELGIAYCARGDYKKWTIEGDLIIHDNASFGWSWWGNVNPQKNGTWASTSCAQRSLLEYCQRGELLLWNSENKFQRVVVNSDTLLTGDYSPDGRHIVTGTFFGIRPDTTAKLIVFNAQSGAVEQTIENAHALSVNMVKYSPTGELFASGSADGTVKLWDATSGTQLSMFEPNAASVRSLTFSKDGNLLYVGTCRSLNNFVCSGGDVYVYSVGGVTNNENL